MILVTGGTGFIGQVLIRQLVSSGRQVRILIRPSKLSPVLPRGVPMEIAVSSLKDERGLRAAMKGVEVVYHLVGMERRGNRADLLSVDIQGTQAVVEAAAEVGVSRLFYLSHLGADRASAYPILKAKAIAESFLRQSGVAYTIFRSAIAYGPRDHFTTGLAQLIFGFPWMFMIPGDGSMMLQPIWVEDLVTCMVWALDLPDSRNQIFSIGGVEYLSFREICEIIMDAAGVHKTLVSVGPPYLRILTVLMEQIFPGFPVSVFWLDYLANSRTCAMDAVPKFFGLMPSRFVERLNHLQGQSWRRSLWRALISRKMR
jgi:nucleoside-diphosphate-sugar epimerase